MTFKSLILYITHPTQLVIRLGKYSFLKYMSDEWYLKVLYKSVLGKNLNLVSPATFNEKLQWLKINDKNPLYTELVDKYEVRNHVAAKIGEEHLVPLVGGPWNSFDEIDFRKLPDQFVLKCTHDSGGLVICRDKSKLDIASAKAKIEKSLRRNYYWNAREWPYKHVKPRIVAEAYMEDENSASGLTDYKFFCFHNQPELIYISQGLENHATARISFFDLEGRAMPFRRTDYKSFDCDITLPSNFKEMVEIARVLAEMTTSPFVRIDLYSAWGRTYFSEVTFSPCGGMLPFDPEEWDLKLGEKIKI